jgi:hypothetical protein
VVRQTTTIRALVTGIDYAKRTITLVGPGGDSKTLKVGPEARRFNEVKKGDHVVASYTEALGISVTKP